jgi:NTE family protein
MRQNKVGLVLGGGGSRGAAHIGVLHVLVRAKVPIDLIVGTSAGGIVAVLFALGYTPRQLIKRLSQIRGRSLINVKHLRARARQRWLRNLLGDALEGKTFADLSIPVALMAVDMVSGAEVALTEGPLLSAILATCATPGVFPVIERNGMQLADGGVIDSLATHAAREQGADRVIAVDVFPSLEQENPWRVPISATLGIKLPFGLSQAIDEARTPHTIASLWRATRVITWNLHKQRLRTHSPDVLLRPQVSRHQAFHLGDLSGLVLAGVVEAERQMAALEAISRTGE